MNKFTWTPDDTVFSAMYGVQDCSYGNVHCGFIYRGRFDHRWYCEASWKDMLGPFVTEAAAKRYMEDESERYWSERGQEM